MIHNIVAPIIQHRSPLRRRRLCAKTEEGQAAGGQDSDGNPQRSLHDDRGCDIRQNMPEDDSSIACAQRTHGINIFELADGQRRAAHDSGKGGDREDADGDDHVEQIFPRTLTTAKASRMPGNASITSVILIMSASHLPP